jgi:choline dehydrogenase-like flavoprotein
MIFDFRDPSVDADHVADVCIVGAGPAGLAIAHELMSTRTSVLLVESGGLEPDTRPSRLNHGYNVGLGLGLEKGRARAFGGTGTLWPGQMMRLDPSDFEPRSWVPDSGWPLTADSLDPYYQRAETWLGVPTDASDEQAWRRYGLTPPAFDRERLDHKTSIYSPHPDVGAHYRREYARSGNVRVLLHATVAGISAGEDGTVPRELELRSLSGRLGRVRARTVVLCGGGIENARLLLLSGLGNCHDAVGRYLHEHPTIWVDIVSDRPKDLLEFYGLLGRGKVRYGPKIGLAWSAQEHQRVLNAGAAVIHERLSTPALAAARAISSAVQERRRPTGLSRRDVVAAVRGLDRVAITGYRRFALGRPSVEPVDWTRMKILVEQAPNPTSRVYLSSERDELGLAKVCVDWRLTELERRTARVVTDHLDAELRRLGLGRLTGTDWLDGDDWTSGFEDAYHPMGTTRMSTDPTKGVVDADCHVHGVQGLYVCGSSVFPTGGYANPTLTIVALAMRLADHLTATSARAS